MGGAGEKGCLDKAEILEAEVLKRSKLPRGRDLEGSGDFGGKIIRRERSYPGRFAKIVFGSGFSAGELPACQVSSRTRVRPSPRGTSAGCQTGLWSKPAARNLLLG